MDCGRPHRNAGAIARGNNRHTGQIIRHAQCTSIARCACLAFIKNEERESSPPRSALLAHPFYDVFSLQYLEVLGHRDSGDFHVLNAPRLMADGAGHVDVAVVMMLMVVAVADTILLHAASIINEMQEPLVSEEGESAENGGLIDSKENVLNIG